MKSTDADGVMGERRPTRASAVKTRPEAMTGRSDQDIW